MTEWTKHWNEDGLLADYGMIPMPKEERAKYTAASSNSPRVTYQAVTVSPNTKYILTAYYDLGVAFHNMFILESVLLESTYWCSISVLFSFREALFPNSPIE